MRLQAPAHWSRIDVISDLHLQASDALTFAAWQQHLRYTDADAVFILGDLFEVWVGDDVLAQGDSFEAQCAQVLRQASAHLAIYLMHGNRDFLLAQQFCDAAHSNLLDDPSLLAFGDQRFLLTHGDALCLADTEYMAFRASVRKATWQQEFLAKPLTERQDIARSLRAHSEAHKRAQSTYADADGPTALAWLEAADATHLLHGHTHQPATHVLADGHLRMVLSDWDLQAQPARAEVLRLRLADDRAEVSLQRLPPCSATSPIP
ncbi:MAG: UDP-2,3-diacylglucosamine diphosphatase, partial [Rhodoferax sp.]